MDRVLKAGGIFVIQAPNLYTNLFSYNYKKNPKNVLAKITRLLKEYSEHKLRTIKEYELDVRFEADRDAYSLISPLWLLRELKKRNYKILEFTSFSFPLKSNKAYNATFWTLGKLPFTKYLGGRIVLVAQKDHGTKHN